MLGVIGFLSASAVFLIYGVSSYKLSKKSKTFDSSSYLYAYIFISIACLIWTFGILADVKDLNSVIMVGDLILLCATIFLAVSMVADKYKMKTLVAGMLATTCILLIRIYSTAEDAFMRDGVLVFNTPRIFGAILALVLFIVWVRSNMNFYDKVIDKKLPEVLRSAYFSSNLLGFIGVTGFLFAKKDITIIASFTFIIFSFVLLSSLNYLVLNKSTKMVKHGK